MRKFTPPVANPLQWKAERMKRQGFSHVLIQKRGCALKLKPHVCANCIPERTAE
jgi:hypothetical protein